VHESAAHLFTLCRKKGLTVHTVDCLIGATALHYKVDLMTADKDFEAIAKMTNLRLWQDSTY
jgi:predicted nucleic acid-binding protein